MGCWHTMIILCTIFSSTMACPDDPKFAKQRDHREQEQHFIPLFANGVDINHLTMLMFITSEGKRETDREPRLTLALSALEIILQHEFHISRKFLQKEFFPRSHEVFLVSAYIFTLHSIFFLCSIPNHFLNQRGWEEPKKRL